MAKLFPKKQKIYLYFSFIKEHKYLLPFGYVLRLVEFIFSKKDAKSRVVADFKRALNAKSDEAENLSVFLQQINS